MGDFAPAVMNEPLRFQPKQEGTGAAAAATPASSAPDAAPAKAAPKKTPKPRNGDGDAPPRRKILAWRFQPTDA